MGCSAIPAKFRKLPFAGILGDTPPKKWADDLGQLVFRGNPLIQEVFFYHNLRLALVDDTATSRVRWGIDGADEQLRYLVGT